MRNRISFFLPAIAAACFLSCGMVSAMEKPENEIPFGPVPQFSAVSAEEISSLPVSLTNEQAGIHLSWEGNDFFSKYTVFRKMEEEETWTPLCDTEETEYLDASCMNGFLYHYAVTGILDGISQNPDPDTGNSLCFLKPPSLYGAVSSLPGSLTVNWGMNEMADGYQISLENGQMTEERDIPGAASLIETIQELQEGNAYTIQLRSYKIIQDVTYYSSWSDAEPVTIQKAIESVQGYSPIMGAPTATAEQMQAYLKMVNPSVSQSVLDMIPYYLSEGIAEGIRGDIAFAQSCLETGNFNFAGSAVTLNQNNFCGLGVTSNGMQGNSFETPQLGIRAQIQHLKAYGSTEPLNNACIDPRFDYVDRASAVYVEWLGSQENPRHIGWASGDAYGAKILSILNRILEM